MSESSAKPAHRGRFQAQGGGIEESVAWAQENPPTVAEGLSMLLELSNLLTPAERQKRSELFQKAREFVENAGRQGGIDAAVSKSWTARGRGGIRVDLEVWLGKAFVNAI